MALAVALGLELPGPRLPSFVPLPAEAVGLHRLEVEEVEVLLEKRSRESLLSAAI